MTPAQQKILDAIKARQRSAGPTLREVAAAVGTSGFAVQRHVGKLREMGLLAAESGDGLVVADSPASVRANTARIKADEKSAFPLIEVKSPSHKPKIPPNYGVPSVRAPIPRPNGKI